MSLAQLLLDAKRAANELQEEAQCAYQVASQVDTALQQAHRNLGYSLQETAAQPDVPSRPHDHLQASAGARHTAEAAGETAELTAEHRGSAGKAIKRKCKAKAHRKHQHRQQDEPGVQQPPQQQPLEQQRHGGRKRKQPEQKLPLRSSPAAAAADGHRKSQDAAFATCPADVDVVKDAAGTCGEQADAASGSSQMSDVEMLDAQEFDASAPTLQAHFVSAGSERLHPQPLQQASGPGSQSHRHQQDVVPPASTGNHAAAAPSTPPIAATPPQASSSTPRPGPAQRSGTAADALAPSDEVIVLSSSSEEDDDELPAGLTSSVDRHGSRNRHPSPGMAARRHPSAPVHPTVPRRFGDAAASLPKPSTAAHAQTPSPLRAYSSGRMPPMVPAMMQDPHASGWPLQQPQQQTAAAATTAASTAAGLSVQSVEGPMQQQQRQQPLTKATIAQRRQLKATATVGHQTVKASTPSPPQRQQATAAHPPEPQRQPPDAEAPAVQPDAVQPAHQPATGGASQLLQQLPQHPPPPNVLLRNLLSPTAAVAASPAARTSAETADQPLADQPLGVRKAPLPRMPVIPAVALQPARVPHAKQQSQQQRETQPQRPRRVKLDELLAQAQPSLQQQQKPAGTAATAAGLTGTEAAFVGRTYKFAPCSAAVQQPAPAQPVKQGPSRHQQRSSAVPAAASARVAAAAPAASQSEAVPSHPADPKPAHTAQQQQQQPRAAIPDLGAAASAVPGSGGGTESDPVMLSSGSDDDLASPARRQQQQQSAASAHTGAKTASASEPTQRTLSSLFKFMAEHPPDAQRQQQRPLQPATGQRLGSLRGDSLMGGHSKAGVASWPAHKTAAAKPASGRSAGTGMATSTAVSAEAPVQQPQPVPQQTQAAQPTQPAAMPAAAPGTATQPTGTAAPDTATSGHRPEAKPVAQAAAQATGTGPALADQPAAVPAAQVPAPDISGDPPDMPPSTAAAADATADAAAAVGIVAVAAAAQAEGDDSPGDRGVELDRQAAWADPEALAAEAAEWEARQAVIAAQAEEARRLKLQRRAATEAQRRAQERLEDHRRDADARAALSQEREALRGPLASQIQARVVGCTTLPQVLRALRQPIEGEPRPTPEQFLKAQKKALIKFHPDRYQSASTAVQVEAEEIFKIISKVPLTAPVPTYAWAPRRW